MAEHPDGRRRHRLGRMTFDEISFVDRGMNQHAAVLFWKRQDEPCLHSKGFTGLTPDGDEHCPDCGEFADDELKEYGKAFHLPGQASSAADCPEGWEFDAENRRCVRKTGKGSHSRQLLQQRLKKREHYADCTCKYCVAYWAEE